MKKTNIKKIILTLIAALLAVSMCFAFAGCSELVDLNLMGVTKICDYAFYSCTALENLVIASSVNSIGYRSFAHLDSVIEIDTGTGITEIPEGAFDWCGKTAKLIIRSNVTKINPAFSYLGCEDILNNNYNFDELIYHGTLNQWANITFVDSGSNPMGALGADENTKFKTYISGVYSTPTTITGITENIGDHAFSSFRQLTRVNYNSSGKTIGANAFSGCSNLETVTINCSVIKSGAFSFCSKLSSVIINNMANITIEGKPFYQCYNLTLSIYNTLKVNGLRVVSGLMLIDGDWNMVKEAQTYPEVTSAIYARAIIMTNNIDDDNITIVSTNNNGNNIVQDENDEQMNSDEN